MKDGRIIDPVRLLKKMYRQDFALPEKDLLQLQSHGAINSFSLAAGEQLSLQGRNRKDSLYLLVGEVSFHTEKDPHSTIHLNSTDNRSLSIGEAGTVTLVAKQDSLLSQVDQDQLDYMVSWKSLLDAGRQDIDITSRIASLRNPSIFRQLPFENIEQAFNKYFVPSPDENYRHDLIVCHGNVMRYLVTKVLNVETMSWLQMSITNCSLTIIRIMPDGKMKLDTFSDYGHIPENMRTYTGGDNESKALVVPSSK